MYKSNYLVLIFALFASQLFAQSVPKHVAPAWINSDLSLSQEKSQVSIAAKDSKTIFVPAGNWVTLPDNIFNKTHIWQGQTLSVMRKLHPNELVCKQKSCQLPASQFMQIFKFVNDNNDWVHLDIKLGNYHTHPNPFRRAIKLPLQANKLSFAQDHQFYYQLNDKKSINLYFEEAKKLKLSVRKPMSNLRIDNKVLAYVNGQPVSLVSAANTHAPEYKFNKVSTVNNDYFSVPKNSYLKITGFGNTLIKLEQMHRAVFDSSAPEKQIDSLLNPYWTMHLEDKFTAIYEKHNVSELINFNVEKASSLEQRRFQDLLSSVSVRRSMQISHRPLSIKSQLQSESTLIGYRKVAQQLFPVSQKRTLTSHLLTDTFEIDLGQSQRVANRAYLHIQSEANGQLIIEGDSKRHVIQFNAAKKYERITIPVSMTTQTLRLFSANKQAINVAIEVDELLTLPNNPLLFLMKGTLQSKSPTLLNILNHQAQLQANAYINSLPQPFIKKTISGQNKQYQLLSKAMSLAFSNPSQALPLLKQLANSDVPSIALDAWRMRIDVLYKLDKASIAHAYLESLVNSEEVLLSNFATKRLFENYSEGNQIFKLQGLCAEKYQQIPKCKNISNNILIAQQKNLLAIWSMHDHMHKNSIINGDWIHQRLLNIKSEEPDIPSFEIKHFGTVMIQGDTAEYDAFKLSSSKPIQIYSSQPVALQLRVRAPYRNDGTQHQQWLHLDKKSSQSILPIFSDVASTAKLEVTDQHLSIANETIIRLSAGEQLTLSSELTQYISITALPKKLEFAELLTSNSVDFLFKQNFSSLVHNPDINLKTLLINALYRLGNKTLNNFEFNLLFAKLNNTLMPTALETLKKRIEHYGTWQPILQYLSYSGTKLVDANLLTQRSLAEQITRHANQNEDLGGLLIRPNHTLSLELADLQAHKIKLVFTFSAAELIKTETADILITTENSSLNWSIGSNSRNELALTVKELQDGIVSLRWLNPFVSQLVSVKIQTFQQGKWQDAQLDTRQLFYFAQKNKQISARLKTDSLVKIERLKQNDREEQTGYYPAGKISITSAHPQLARFFTWQLDLNKSKTRFAPSPKPIKVEKPTYLHITQKQPFYEEILSSDENLTHIDGFFRYNRAGIFETETSQSARHFSDVGFRFRNKDKQHWYLLESFITLDSQNYETFSINGKYNWLSQTSHWFGEARINNRWQDDSLFDESHLTSNISFKIGEIWRDDTTHRHQWWVQPFFHYSSITAGEYFADTKMSPPMFSYYREDHMHGWRSTYQYRYQPWVDHYLSASISSTSNADWTSLDNLGFIIQAQQFYQGHVFTLSGASQYSFADQHRQNNTWQYLTQMSWQTLFDFSDETAGWIKLSWTQDWFRKDHSLRFEVNLGNLQNTGFGPFAHDEILFESLQLSHLLEQDIYEQK